MGYRFEQIGLFLSVENTRVTILCFLGPQKVGFLGGPKMTILRPCADLCTDLHAHMHVCSQLHAS